MIFFCFNQHYGEGKIFFLPYYELKNFSPCTEMQYRGAVVMRTRRTTTGKIRLNTDFNVQSVKMLHVKLC